MDGNTTSALDGVPFRVTNPELISAKRYYDEEFFRLENERLWPHVWQMACRLEEIPNEGDYTVYTILDRSVILINTKNGVKAFRNACRHRGVRLAHGPGNCAKDGFVCPFHGWRYDSEGKNTFVFGPKLFSPELLEQAEINLAPVRIEFWAGCAFINFDDNAPSLRDCLGPVATRIDARNGDKLKMDWWYGTVLPTNWKLANEAFQEGYHVMRTHPQLWFVMPNAAAGYGPDAEGLPVNEGLNARQMVNAGVNFLSKVGEGMAGMVHETEIAVLERLRDMPAPEDPDQAYMAFYGAACDEIVKDARARGADMFDIAKVNQEVGFNSVEFMFPNFFLLPTFGAMSSYRIRPLTPETCYFELWSLVIRPDNEPFDTPTEPTFLPYDSPDYPEIPRQDYSNLPIQQLGLHEIDYMRLGKGAKGLGGEGMISNYQRLVDGYLACLDPELLAKGSQIVNSGFDSVILDIGF
jgi:phenylpropionate dioxygenase-like ring-hydroxylating dioxygenase large terminal subunit